ncbi:protein BatD [Marinomonas rhizomae]|uniref:Oxygen tolerance protein BatD n=1 Tax=Marinomonas rhizomae TaxID=491948 RepID=A0A366JHE9_9GAMM|nr:BatD family protein [Marinomonas rhizomae]RBP85879.1 oxygen tolerance protein BatD [Marinomonas rhizomae]RNF71031.1 protein BatD [Marinomonas rhizomae]
MVIKQYLLSLISQNKPSRLFFSLMTTLFFIALSSSLHASSVTATLNKNVATENEVVQLTLRADFSDTGNGPDLSPLERDFDILGKSQNSQFSFNLGTSKALNFWVVTLMPKSVGTVEIPPIKIGNYESQPIRLTIKSSPQLMDSNGNPPVMLKTEVSEIEPYLQQEVILSVKLYTSVALQNANRSAPSHPDLVMERLIDDQMNYQTINGTQYQVITREYLAFPQRSGLLTIPPQSIQAMINTSNGRRMIKVQSEPLNLQVIPIPASYTGDAWLPSKKVSVSTTLDKTTDTPRVGDTLIWTIDIKAEGALPEQIPTLDFNSTRNYKLYPKPPKFDNQKTANGVIGHQSITVEVVPTEQGPLTLPNINITYWDTEKRTISTASAATKAIEIGPLPSASGKTTDTTVNKQTIDEPLAAQSPSVAPISLAKIPVEKATQTTPAATENGVDLEVTQTDNDFTLRHYLIAGLLLLAIATLSIWSIIWFKRKREQPDHSHQVPTLQDFAPLSTSDEQSAYKALIECCEQNDLQSLRPNLLEWARHRWGDNEIRSVDDIKRLTSVQVTQLLMEAELMLYSNNPAHEWQGHPLADSLEEYTSGQTKPSQASQLKTLYPNF